MRVHLDLRHHNIGGGVALRPVSGPDLAAAVPGMTVILPRLGDAVEFTRRHVVPHAIDLIVGEPERLVAWVEGYADRIADATGIGFLPRTIPVHALDAAIGVHLRTFVMGPDIVELSHRQIELVIRANGADPGAVVEVLFLLGNELF